MILPQYSGHRVKRLSFFPAILSHTGQVPCNRLLNVLPPSITVDFDIIEEGVLGFFFVSVTDMMNELGVQ